MPYTYFNNGFSYFNGSSYYVTYYPKITSVTVKTEPTSVAYNGSTILTVKVYGNNLSNYTKNTTVTLSSSALSLSKTKLVSKGVKTISPNSIGFTTHLYNVNDLSFSRSVNVNVLASVSYFGPYSSYHTCSMSGSCSVIAQKKNTVTPSGVSYYSYYDSYFTYFYNGKLTVTYYTINDFALSPSNVTVAYNGSVNLNPIVQTNCPGAKVSSILYNVSSPYTVSLSSAKQINIGRKYSDSPVTLYNSTTKDTKTTNVVKATAYLTSGAFRSASATVVSECKPNVVKPSGSSYYYISGPTNVSVSTSGASFVVNTKNLSVSGSNISGCSWSFSKSAVKLSDNSWISFYTYFTLSSSGNYAWVGKTGAALPESINVPITVRGVAENGTKFETTHTCYFEALGKAYFPAIKDFRLSTSPSSTMAFNGYTYINYNLELSNDSVKYISVNGISSSSVCRLTNTINGAGTSGSLCTLVGRPEICHSGAVVTVSATAYTNAGLSKSAKIDVKVKPTDMSYYNTYYAPVISSAFITGKSSLTYNENNKYMLNYVVLRDTVKSISWKSSNDDVFAIGSHNLRITDVQANNTEYVAKSVTLTATVTTWSDLTRSVSKVVRIAGAPEPVDVKPTTDEVIVKVNEILNNKKNATAIEIAKLA